MLGTLWGGVMLDLPGSGVLLKLHDRIAACGQGAKIMQDNATGRLVYTVLPCNSRLCPTCCHRRARTTKETVRAAVAAMDSPRLLTLTLASSDNPLSAELERLRVCFREMRRSKAWRAHVAGGVAIIEVTYNKKTGLWHPHMHCVIDAKYWPQEQISRLWHRVTGDSQVVDIRLVRSKDQAAGYVAKYVSKLPDQEQTPAEKRCEWAVAMHGLRLVQTFGSLHGRKLRPEKTPRPEGLSEVVQLRALLDAINEGDLAALDLHRRLEKLPWGAEDDAATDQHRQLAADLRRWWERRITPAGPDPVEAWRQRQKPPPPPPPPSLYDD